MMKLEEARDLAEDLVARMRPHCLRVEIAGSIRRCKPEVKDIEIVAVPRWGEEPGHDLFATPERVNHLHTWALKEAPVAWIKPGASEIEPWLPKPEGKYWRGFLPRGVKLDLFLTSLSAFGLIYLIRTGSAEFSQAVVTHALRIGKPSRDGTLRDGELGPAIPTPEEADVFQVLGLEWVNPEDRTGPEVVRIKAKGER